MQEGIQKVDMNVRELKVLIRGVQLGQGLDQHEVEGE